jgi:hypothetical protein
MKLAYTPRGVCYTPNCIPPLWTTCKVLHRGMQILENYACCQYCLLHDTNVFLLPVQQASCHTCQIIFFTKPPKLLQVYYASTVFGLNQGPRALYMITNLHQLLIYTSMKHSLLQTFENKCLRFNL